MIINIQIYDCDVPIKIGLYVSIISFFFSIISIFADYKGEKLYNIIDDLDLKKSVVTVENSNIKNLPVIYWITTLFTIFCYGSYMPFNFIASGFLTENFFNDIPKSQAEQKAGIYMSIPFAISCIFVPLFGLIVDKYGNRANITFISSILGIFGYTSFFYIAPLFGFITLGFSYSLTATVVWNIFSIVVKGNQLALAIGIISSLINLILFINPIIIAAIYARSHSYYVVFIQ
jgi:MFS family permease